MIGFVMADVDETYARLVELGVAFVGPRTDKPWGLRYASVLDPLGYTLTRSSYLD